MKTVQVIGYAFDCLPGHVTIAERGSGSNLRTATVNAIRNLLNNDRLKKKTTQRFQDVGRGRR